MMKLALLVLACATVSVAWPDPAYDEQYRPQYHFSPPQQWMNDPNGMVFAGGEYHLFYQYNPYANQWGPMHWGHAISRDLVHWENRPIALFPDQHGTIFSGSAVLDAENTSGFGFKDKPALVAMFTYNSEFPMPGEPSNAQSQGLAYSLDEGRSWIKYPQNPVLTSSGQKDFRDPKVFWSATRHLWIVTLAVRDHVAFYSSPDLKHWNHESDFGEDSGAHGGVWECPDLIDMAVAGEKSRKAVLLVSVGRGGPNGGSGTQYFVGDFDGHAFTPDASKAPGAAAARWLDYGTDDYAGSTWSGLKRDDGRQLFIGWMSNWAYANLVPTVRWRSAFTIPRDLTLRRTAAGLELHSLPAPELAALRSDRTTLAARAVAGELLLTTPPSPTGLLELEIALDSRRSTTIDLVFRNAQGQQTSFRINKPARRYEVDRSASGNVSFSPSFANLQTAPIVGPSTRFKVHAFLDRSSIELFINDGQTVFTTIEFPEAPYDSVTLKADRPIGLDSSTVYRLRSIWHDAASGAPVSQMEVGPTGS